MRKWIGTLTLLIGVVLLGVVGLGGSAIADGDKGEKASADSGGGGSGIELQMEIQPRKLGPDEDEGDFPRDIEVTVIGGPNLPKEKFTLRDAKSKEPYELKASVRRDFNQSTETVAIALVMNTWEVWVGNDDMLPEEDPSRYPGVLKSLEQALDGLKFTDAGPKGSKGMVVVYADKATIRVPMGDLKEITGQKLGTQKDYFGTKGVEMVKGIELAMGQLHDVTAARKVLIVVCDGHDTNPEAAKSTLRKLKGDAAKDKIQTFAIVYKSALSDIPSPETVIQHFTNNVSTVNTADNIAATIDTILKRMNDRYYLTFPGWDDKADQGLEWDGKPHQLVLKIDKDDQEPYELNLSPEWSKPHHRHWFWYIVIAAGVLLLLLIIILIATRKKAVPMPVVAPVVAAVQEAPKPVGPMKTVMLAAGGDQDGFPIVGWLVPLNGQNAYQTFRLKAGLTKIGTTAANADIVINDGFMSTDHCQITSSPQGFTLIDGGSTNGSYVNDKRIQKHDLVDNDMIQLGRTNFKFKSIS